MQLFSILIRLICAHILADFFLQPKSWITDRTENGIKSRCLYYHVAIVTVLSYLFLAHWRMWQIPLFIGITHWIIDWWKSRQKDNAVYFALDQAAHLTAILAAWFWLLPVPPINFHHIRGTNLWIALTIYLLALRPAGFLIAKITARWEHQLRDEHNGKKITGLENAGTWIGYIERLIIITFILLHQFSAIGFLIAAKSIFRFSGGVKDEKERRYAEYILIGTLISFFIAIILGIAALSFQRI